MITFILAFLPIILLFFFVILNKPYWGLVTIFIVNYFVMGISRYIDGLPGGITMDSLLVLTIIGVVAQTIYGNIEWKRVYNGLTLVAFIWLIYCTLELLNPEALSKIAWTRTIRGVAGYFIIVTSLTFLLFHKYRDMKWIMNIWAVLTLLAVIKALMQKFYGFDSVELRWLQTVEEERILFIQEHDISLFLQMRVILVQEWDIRWWFFQYWHFM